MHLQIFLNGLIPGIRFNLQLGKIKSIVLIQWSQLRMDT